MKKRSRAKKKKILFVDTLAIKFLSLAMLMATNIFSYKYLWSSIWKNECLLRAELFPNFSYKQNLFHLAKRHFQLSPPFKLRLLLPKNFNDFGFRRRRRRIHFFYHLPFIVAASTFSSFTKGNRDADSTRQFSKELRAPHHLRVVWPSRHLFHSRSVSMLYVMDICDFHRNIFDTTFRLASAYANLLSIFNNIRCNTWILSDL